MSYERQNSTRLEQYRARQAERIDAMNRAIEAGQTTVVASSTGNVEPVRTDFKKAVVSSGSVVGRARRGARRFTVAPQLASTPQGGRKRLVATGVESAIRPRIDIRIAAFISGTEQNEPQDGQLFAYDASIGKIVPVDERDVAQGIRVGGRGKLRRHTLVTVRNK